MVILAGEAYICVVRSPADPHLWKSAIYPPGEPNLKMEFGNNRKDPLDQIAERVTETMWIVNAARGE